MMRTALYSLALAPILLAAGCPLGCGAYAGQQDRVYQNGTDALILCMNTGFVVVADGSPTLEGTYTSESGASNVVAIGTDGTTHATDFVALDNSDDTASIPQLAPGDWQELSLDPAQLDHYDWYCQQLTSQSWWTGGSSETATNGFAASR